MDSPTTFVESEGLSVFRFDSSIIIASSHDEAKDFVASDAFEDAVPIEQWRAIALADDLSLDGAIEAAMTEGGATPPFRLGVKHPDAY